MLPIPNDMHLRPIVLVPGEFSVGGRASENPSPWAWRPVLPQSCAYTREIFPYPRE